MKKCLILHPFLFAIYPIFFLYSQNLGELSEVGVFVTIRPLFVVIASLLVFLILGRLVFKNFQLSAVIVSFSLILFFSYGVVFDIFHSSIRHRYLFLIWFFLWIFGLWFSIKIRNKIHFATQGLNIIAIVMILTPVMKIGTFYVQSKNLFSHRAEATGSPVSNNEGFLHSPEQIKNFPDIYYIIFDSYTGSRSLKKYWNYDNSEIANYLDRKGFYIASESRSNYPRTNFSMPSTFNMQYLPDFEGLINGDFVGREWRTNLLLNFSDSKKKTAVKGILGLMKSKSKVVQFLKSKGYRCLDYSNWNHKKEATYKGGIFRYLSDFEEYLISMTMLKVKAHIWFPKGAAGHFFEVLRKVMLVPDIEEPTFTYAHFMIPHDFLFLRDGNYMPAGRLATKDVSEIKKLYLEQVLFANKKIKEMVDEILAKSKVEPIIIIQGDHGAWNVPLESEEETRDLQVSIFNVYHLPGQGKKFLYKSITPVNTFRLVFDTYFGTNYGLLEDKSFYDKDPYSLSWVVIPKKF